VKKNLWFGTGNAVYTYQLGQRTVRQSAHNGIIESLTSFGLVGTIMIVFILAVILMKNLLSKMSLRNKILAMYVFITVGGFPMMQPILFNLIILSHAMIFLGIL
jgi:O-antigen ligase